MANEFHRQLSGVRARDRQFPIQGRVERIISHQHDVPKLLPRVLERLIDQRDLLPYPEAEPVRADAPSSVDMPSCLAFKMMIRLQLCRQIRLMICGRGTNLRTRYAFGSSGACPAPRRDGETLLAPAVRKRLLTPAEPPASLVKRSPLPLSLTAASPSVAPSAKSPPRKAANSVPASTAPQSDDVKVRTAMACLDASNSTGLHPSS